MQKAHAYVPNHAVPRLTRLGTAEGKHAESAASYNDTASCHDIA
jgi:hypothetical protein